MTWVRGWAAITKDTEAMIFGEAPTFDAILASIGALEEQLDRP